MAFYSSINVQFRFYYSSQLSIWSNDSFSQVHLFGFGAFPFWNFFCILCKFLLSFYYPFQTGVIITNIDECKTCKILNVSFGTFAEDDYQIYSLHSLVTFTIRCSIESPGWFGEVLRGEHQVELWNVILMVLELLVDWNSSISLISMCCLFKNIHFVANRISNVESLIIPLGEIQYVNLVKCGDIYNVLDLAVSISGNFMN